MTRMAAQRRTAPTQQSTTPVLGAVLAYPSIPPILWTSTSGGFWAGSLWYLQSPRVFCYAGLRTLLPPISLRPRLRSPGCTAAVAASDGGLLAALKDELFSLETDHLQGRLSDPEYEEQKQALELVLRRALSRKPA